MVVHFCYIYYMRRKKTIIEGVAMVPDEEVWIRNKRGYNLIDIQCEAEVAKSAQSMNADELKYPSQLRTP